MRWDSTGSFTIDISAVFIQWFCRHHKIKVVCKDNSCQPEKPDVFGIFLNPSSILLPSPTLKNFWQEKLMIFLNLKAFNKLGIYYVGIITIAQNIIKRQIIKKVDEFYFYCISSLSFLNFFCQNFMNEADCIKKSLHKVF